MSDLSLSLEALDRSRTQLHVADYFDAQRYQREMELLFRPGPRYVGHALMVPEPGSYHTLAHEGEGRMLVRRESGVHLMSNVCRHRQAIMLHGRGQTGAQVVCPLHRWTYDLRGNLLGAPHFEQDPCLKLREFPVHNWNGLLFDTAGSNPAADLSLLGACPELDFSGYVYDKTIVHDCDYNWKTFIEVYLEDYHVGPFHPGLGNFVSCEDLRWEMAPECSLQTVGMASPGGQALGRAGSDVYKRWQAQVLQFEQGRPPRHGAIWLTYYPGVMVEWYPNVLVVSTLHPKGPRKTVNLVEFYYPEEIAAFEPEYVQAQQAAYMETCIEDDEIALRMDAGRKALLERGSNEYGPYQSPMEDGMQHFHEWYRRKMG